MTGAGTIRLFRHIAALALLLQGAACAAPCDQVDSLPLRLETGFPLVPMTVNGVELPFVLDTGATSTVLRPETAARLRLPEDARQRGHNIGIGGAVTAQNAWVERLRLGRRNLTGLSVPVAALADAELPLA